MRSGCWKAFLMLELLRLCYKSSGSLIQRDRLRISGVLAQDGPTEQHAFFLPPLIEISGQKRTTAGVELQGHEQYSPAWFRSTQPPGCESAVREF